MNKDENVTLANAHFNAINMAAMSKDYVNKEIITLSSGKRVANFSSPHSFEFEDGTILPAVPSDYSKKLEMDSHNTVLKAPGNFGDIIVSFFITDEILAELSVWLQRWRDKKVDIVFVPFPLLTEMKKSKGLGEAWLLKSPFRTIRCVDRNSKKVSIDFQCI